MHLCLVPLFRGVAPSRCALPSSPPFAPLASRRRIRLRLRTSPRAILQHTASAIARRPHRGCRTLRGLCEECVPIPSVCSSHAALAPVATRRLCILSFASAFRLSLSSRAQRSGVEGSAFAVAFVPLCLCLRAFAFVPLPCAAARMQQSQNRIRNRYRSLAPTNRVILSERSDAKDPSWCAHRSGLLHFSCTRASRCHDSHCALPSSPPFAPPFDMRSK